MYPYGESCLYKTVLPWFCPCFFDPLAFYLVSSYLSICTTDHYLCVECWMTPVFYVMLVLSQTKGTILFHVFVLCFKEKQQNYCFYLQDLLG